MVIPFGLAAPGLRAGLRRRTGAARHGRRHRFRLGRPARL